MKLAMEALAEAHGLPDHKVPGGKNTVAALMRRELCEIAGSEEMGWIVFLPDHKHAFVTLMHIDGCHNFMTRASCACGVHYAFDGERSGRADGYSAMWYMDGCERCEALLHGARPRYEVTIWRPSNYRPPLATVPA